MMNSVKRWQPEIVMDGKKPRIHIREWDFGIYVAHEDYAALAERVRVLEEALRVLLNERDSDLDMWHCPFHSRLQPELYDAWVTAVKESWHKLDILKAHAQAALLAQPAQSGDTEKGTQ